MFTLPLEPPNTKDKDVTLNLLNVLLISSKINVRIADTTNDGASGKN